MHEVLTAVAARLHRRTERRGQAGTAVPIDAPPRGRRALRTEREAAVRCEQQNGRRPCVASKPGGGAALRTRPGGHVPTNRLGPFKYRKGPFS